MRKTWSAVVCGAGAAGVMHALVLRTAGARIAGVFDPDPSRARALAEMHGCEAHASEASLWDTPAELACIASPPPHHVAQAERAARFGRVVFVEKPLATTRAELARLARVPGCVPIVQWRAGRALRAVRAAIARGELGPSPTASVDLAWSRDASYFAAGRGTMRAWGCGVLLSVGVHAIDAITWAIGRPVVDARGMLGGAPDLEVETRAAMLLAFQGGALASVRATFDAGPDATRITFAGGGVSATIEGGELDPTAGAVQWSCADDARLARLRAIEANAGGATAAPLLVPYLLDAVAALGRGAEPGACDALPSVADVEPAHAAIFSVYERAGAPVL